VSSTTSTLLADTRADVIWVLLLKKVCGNVKSRVLQASRDEMTERRGFEREFQGLGKLSVPFK
jgi:hypothetical protein